MSIAWSPANEKLWLNSGEGNEWEQRAGEAERSKEILKDDVTLHTHPDTHYRISPQGMFCPEEEQAERRQACGVQFAHSLTRVGTGGKESSFIHPSFHPLTVVGSFPCWTPSISSIESWVYFPLHLMLGQPVTRFDQWNGMEVTGSPSQAQPLGACARL